MAKVYLLDTNVVSELVKKTPNHNVLKNLHRNEDFCTICSVVWQEMIYGFEKMPEGKRKKEIGIYVDKIRRTYDILPYDSFAAQICGEIRSRCAKNGKAVPLCDSQIAATAIANGMILITRNTDDFKTLQENSMLKVENWWEE